uniref:Retrotransposon gag domain-containing protein n=1 Tax=Megaselia scalaris TaxID=36166 RepID=T1GET7_MEGSC
MKLKINELASAANASQLIVLRRWAEEVQNEKEELYLNKLAYGIPVTECQELLKENNIRIMGSELRQRNALRSYLNNSTGILRESFVIMAEDFALKQETQLHQNVTGSFGTEVEPALDTVRREVVQKTHSIEVDPISLEQGKEKSRNVPLSSSTIRSDEIQDKQIRDCTLQARQDDSSPKKSQNKVTTPTTEEQSRNYRKPSRSFRVDESETDEESYSSEVRQKKHRRGGMDTASLMDTVRKWNIHFADSGKPQDAIRFIDDLEIRADCYQIDKNRLPRAMPELLRSQALDWYRNNQEEWLTWNSFVQSFTEFFVPQRMRMQIEDEV